MTIDFTIDNDCNSMITLAFLSILILAARDTSPIITNRHAFVGEVLKLLA